MAPPMANPGSPSVLAETIVIPDSVRSIPETWSGEPEKTLGEALETFSALCSQKFSQNAQATETLASEAEQLLDAMLKNAAQPAGRNGSKGQGDRLRREAQSRNRRIPIEECPGQETQLPAVVTGDDFASSVHGFAM